MKTLDMKTLGAKTSGNPWHADREPWTVERTLHLGLAAVAVMGWTIAYTALTRGIAPPDRVARHESAGTKVSVNLVSPAP